MEGRHLKIRFFLATACLVVYLSIGSNSRAEELTKAPVENSIEFGKHGNKSLTSSIGRQKQLTRVFVNISTEVNKRERAVYITNGKINLEHKARTPNSKNSKDTERKKLNIGTLVKPWSVNFKSENIPTNINKKILGVELMYEMRF